MVRLPFRDGFYELRPSKIIALAKNYAEHARERRVTSLKGRYSSSSHHRL